MKNNFSQLKWTSTKTWEKTCIEMVNVKGKAHQRPCSGCGASRKRREVEGREGRRKKGGKKEGK
jgi:hypothetical protein